jgi:glucose/arabinose dehydrogenase
MLNNRTHLGLLSLVVIFIFGLLLGAIAMRKRPLNSIAVFDADKEKITWNDEVIAKNLEIPWDIAEEPTGRLLVTERTGKLKALEDDGSIITIGQVEVALVSESGLTGIALHPNFDTNRFVYLYYTYRLGGELKNKVTRFTLVNNVLKEDKTILDGLTGGQIHNGGRLRFGPDKKLYVLTGDGARPALAQELNSLAGKVIRINDDGAVPTDNPFPNSPIYSLGHRNPQGLDWHTLTEELFVTEHGETAHDELNLIKPGKNYGWPKVKTGFGADPDLVNPILESGNDTWAPSGLAFYGASIWGLRNSAFMAGLRSQSLRRLDISDGKVQKQEILIKGKYGRLRAVYITKSGEIIISTSNRDGRGQPTPDDDRLIKLTPVREQ